MNAAQTSVIQHTTLNSMQYMYIGKLSYAEWAKTICPKQLIINYQQQ